MNAWAVACFLGGFACWMTGLFLAFYLDLRIHALRQSGDLPHKTPQLFALGFSWIGGGFGIFPRLSPLYSREFREIDGHTRLLAPVIRVFLPLGPALFVAGVTWDFLSR